MRRLDADVKKLEVESALKEANKSGVFLSNCFRVP